MSLKDSQITSFKDQLLQKEKDLVQSLALANQSAETVELDQAMMGRVSRGDALLQQSMAKAGQDRTQQLLVKVRAALERVTEGEFGDCVECFEPIGMARLKLMPECDYCINCQSKLES